MSKKNKKLEELADLLVKSYKNGYKYDDDEFRAGEILAYYAEKLAKVESELETLQHRVNRIRTHYIKKDDSHTKKEKNLYTAFNAGLDATLQEVAPVEYIRFKDRDKYY